MKAIDVPAGSVQKVYLAAPRYKRFGNSYFYRFHLEVNPAPPEKPALYLQMVPSNTSAD
ncbi:MAG: hypothetical protein GY940_01260 [bacterium]|nr:hypothetical protein [bacterium]